MDPSESAASQDLKILIIYYSFEGSTRLVAEAMASAAGADLLPITPQKEMSSRGFSKYFWGSSQVMMKRKPKLQPFPLNPREYDLIFIGTPVWAWTFSPPVGTLLNEIDFGTKKTALFCCHGGQKGKTIEHMKEKLAHSQVMGETDFIEPVKKNTESAVEKAKAWALEMVHLATEIS